MKLKTLCAIVIAAALTYACTETVTTESGIEISFIKKGTEVLEDSSIILINMQYINANGADLFNTLEQGSPIPLPVYKSVWDSIGGFYGVLSLCKVDDSVAFKINAKELFVNTFKMEQVPDTIDATSDIQFYLGIKKQMNQEEFQAYRMEEFNKQQAKLAEEAAEKAKTDIIEIDKYLADNAIAAETTESGLRYAVTQQGSGNKPEAGQTVEVHYTGTLMDGTKFDSSYDRNQTFEFPLGQGRVIKGWDEGIALLNVGSKATLYIPSALGYGARATGSIPANSILKFDVELISIK